jgi:hypothetical protein
VSRVSFARRLGDLADADPDRLAVTCGDTSLTRASSTPRPQRWPVIWPPGA